MIISPEAVTILANFSTINQAVVLRPGSSIQTMNKGETIFAKAEVPDVFSEEAGIYDLSRFLGIISLTDAPSDIEFHKKYMDIRQGNSHVKYAYAPTKLIATPPPGTIKMGDIDVSFTLDESVWKEVSSAMHIMEFAEFAFVGEEGKLLVQALSTKNESSDTYSAEIGKCDLTFQAIITAEKMKLIPGNYAVNITRKGLAHFRGDVAEYWIAISQKSQFED